MAHRRSAELTQDEKKRRHRQCKTEWARKDREKKKKNTESLRKHQTELQDEQACLTRNIETLKDACQRLDLLLHVHLCCLVHPRLPPLTQSLDCLTSCITTDRDDRRDGYTADGVSTWLGHHDVISCHGVAPALDSYALSSRAFQDDATDFCQSQAGWIHHQDIIYSSPTSLSNTLAEAEIVKAFSYPDTTAHEENRGTCGTAPRTSLATYGAPSLEAHSEHLWGSGSCIHSPSLHPKAAETFSAWTNNDSSASLMVPLTEELGKPQLGFRVPNIAAPSTVSYHLPSKDMFYSCSSSSMHHSENVDPDPSFSLLDAAQPQHPSATCGSLSSVWDVQERD